MTLEEYVERTKFEHNITYETKDIIGAIKSIAKEKAINNVACLTDDEVKEIILNYKDDAKVKGLKKKIDKEVKDDSSKQSQQIALF